VRPNAHMSIILSNITYGADIGRLQTFATLIAVGGVITTILWLVIGWRAMRAHERIAAATSEWVKSQRSSQNQYPTFPPPKFPAGNPPKQEERKS